MPDYPQHITQERFASLRSRNIDTGRTLIRSTALGAQKSPTDKERNTLAKSEAKSEAAAIVHLDVLSNPDATTAEQDAASIEDAKCMRTVAADAQALSQAIEDKSEAIENAFAADADEYGAAMVAALAEAHEAAVPYAEARAGLRAMRDRNPFARRSRPTPARLTGGTMLPNLLAVARDEVATLPPVEYVSPEEWGKLKRGFPAVTLSGDPVEGDRPVRVKYDRPLGTREDSVGAGAE